MRTLLALTLSTLLALAAGCSDESVAPDAAQGTQNIQGTIGASDFELTLDAASDHSRRRLEGPFVLRGSNVHYVDSLQALSVDLTVTNRGRVSHPEPIGLTFIKLIPDSVTVLNPDSVSDDGAAIVFAFENDDAMWTPGEKSLPHQVLFDVGPGVSIGFIARLDIGSTPIPTEGGTIGGRVWNDENKDGIVDSTEAGMPGVLIALRSIDDGPSMRVTPAVWRTRTGEDGNYKFTGLASGVYIVSKALATPQFLPTTPTEITVVLTTQNGDTSDFLDANFGCVPMSPPPPPIGMGVRVEARGEYEPLPEPHLVATKLNLARCKNDDGDDDDDDGDDNDDDLISGITNGGGDCPGGVLRGVITNVDRDHHQVDVMGTPVYFPEIPDDLEADQRIEVQVMKAGNVGAWTAVKWAPWEGDYDGVTGRVEAVETVDGVLRLLVVDTWVVPAHIVSAR